MRSLKNPIGEIFCLTKLPILGHFKILFRNRDDYASLYSPVTQNSIYKSSRDVTDNMSKNQIKLSREGGSRGDNERPKLDNYVYANPLVYQTFHNKQHLRHQLALTSSSSSYDTSKVVNRNCNGTTWR